jgi:alpha-amylase
MSIDKKTKCPSVCLYFQVHQPFRMRPYRIFEVQSNHNYFDDNKNHVIMHRIAKNCYYPANNILLDMIEETGGKVKVAFSVSGTFLDQANEHDPRLIQSFKALSDTGCVEFLSETYHHSLSFLKSKEEFKEQIKMHREKIKELFGQEPKVFRNTELIFNNEIAHDVNELGYEGILAEGAAKVLGWQSPNYLFSCKGAKNLKLLLKNYRLSDDIAFRFSNKNWDQFPLTAEKFVSWLKRSEGDTVNLFLDYETFGEHHCKDSGILEFLESFLRIAVKEGIEFKTPSQTIKSYTAKEELDIKEWTSWADIERDISAWTGNSLQNAAFDNLYKIEKEIKEKDDELLLKDWRKLTTSDHFYYMCTKYDIDGDVHKYFSPYDSPYDAYMNFMNILKDIVFRLKGIKANNVEELFEQQIEKEKIKVPQIKA